ncbi:hypothetical protein MCOR02_004662 [Pyricularia oryzae]|uniref:Uncharacterized protein n=3 Tax=Pyricularia oryzae TaxID=318829 RepID=A0A4P7N0B0_PYROR|nr:podosporapepsin [Pyricularia oryzae Y34]KAH8842493.1 hypothetical protein MCOR01_006399 [Pyricularia oryzae]KAH9435743.1 hypothetical protein MCOR02_004662 [Pyricularia oryzae]KAI6258587.1 hypothetical protein MCOR19_005044 [Pyricularia oryzae]KAI6311474.1 hypothetical protein MCOR29_008278 [Pyricularia oryzae]
MLEHVLLLTIWAISACGAPSPSGLGGRFHIDQVHNRNARRNGPVEYAFAHAKYHAPIPKGLSKTMAAIKKVNINAGNATGEVPSWPQELDIEYLSPIMVGEPAQMVWMNLDTGSSDTWMYASTTGEGHKGDQKFYAPEVSKTSTHVPNTSWWIEYDTDRLAGDGTYASGDVWKDTLSIGDVEIKNMTIQTALMASVAMVTDVNMSGLAGLCPNHPSTVMPSQPTLLEKLEPVLDEFVFAADLRYQDTGRFRFGHVPKSDYEGEIHWARMNKTSKFWQFDINSVHVGGTNILLQSTWSFIADTGTTLMLLPMDLTKMYYDQVPGAEYNEWYDSYTFPCNETKNLPSWDFQIAGLNGTVPGHYIAYTNVTEKLCYGGIQPWSAETYGFGILGDVFLKAVYAVFDVQNKTVGFANKKVRA